MNRMACNIPARIWKDRVHHFHRPPGIIKSMIFYYANNLYISSDESDVIKLTVNSP